MATEREPAEVIYRAARNDIENAIQVAEGRTFGGQFNPAFRNTSEPARNELARLDRMWERVERWPDPEGRTERAKVARDATRSAIAVHESLPGAPPAPAWLQEVTRTRGTLDGPRPPLSLTKELADSARDTLGPVKSGSKLILFAAAGVGAVVLVWALSR